eukprot:jgi/Mesvir1/20797/Mv07902-RA.1
MERMMEAGDTPHEGMGSGCFPCCFLFDITDALANSCIIYPLGSVWSRCLKMARLRSDLPPLFEVAVRRQVPTQGCRRGIASLVWIPIILLAYLVFASSSNTYREPWVIGVAVQSQRQASGSMAMIGPSMGDGGDAEPGGMSEGSASEDGGSWVPVIHRASSDDDGREGISQGDRGDYRDNPSNAYGEGGAGGKNGEETGDGVAAGEGVASGWLASGGATQATGASWMGDPAAMQAPLQGDAFGGMGMGDSSQLPSYGTARAQGLETNPSDTAQPFGLFDGLLGSHMAGQLWQPQAGLPGAGQGQVGPATDPWSQGGIGQGLAANGLLPNQAQPAAGLNPNNMPLQLHTLPIPTSMFRPYNDQPFGGFGAGLDNQAGMPASGLPQPLLFGPGSVPDHPGALGGPMGGPAHLGGHPFLGGPVDLGPHVNLGDPSMLGGPANMAGPSGLQGAQNFGPGGGPTLNPFSPLGGLAGSLGLGSPPPQAAVQEVESLLSAESSSLFSWVDPLLKPDAGTGAQGEGDRVQGPGTQEEGEQMPSRAPPQEGMYEDGDEPRGEGKAEHEPDAEPPSSFESGEGTSLTGSRVGAISPQGLRQRLGVGLHRGGQGGPQGQGGTVAGAGSAVERPAAPARRSIRFGPDGQPHVMPGDSLVGVIGNPRVEGMGAGAGSNPAAEGTGAGAGSNAAGLENRRCLSNCSPASTWWQALQADKAKRAKEGGAGGVAAGSKKPFAVVVVLCYNHEILQYLSCRNMEITVYLICTQLSAVDPPERIKPCTQWRTLSSPMSGGEKCQSLPAKPGQQPAANKGGLPVLPHPMVMDAIPYLAQIIRLREQPHDQIDPRQQLLFLSGAVPWPIGPLIRGCAGKDVGFYALSDSVHRVTPDFSGHSAWLSLQRLSRGITCATPATQEHAFLQAPARSFLVSRARIMRWPVCKYQGMMQAMTEALTKVCAVPDVPGKRGRRSEYNVLANLVDHLWGFLFGCTFSAHEDVGRASGVACMGNAVKVSRGAVEYMHNFCRGGGPTPVLPH